VGSKKTRGAFSGSRKKDKLKTCDRTEKRRKTKSGPSEGPILLQKSCRRKVKSGKKREKFKSGRPYWGFYHHETEGNIGGGIQQKELVGGRSGTLWSQQDQILRKGGGGGEPISRSVNKVTKGLVPLSSC